MLYTLAGCFCGSVAWNISKEVYFLEFVPINERGLFFPLRFTSKRFFNTGFLLGLLGGLYYDIVGEPIITSIINKVNSV